jgi:heat shock protein HslJ
MRRPTRVLAVVFAAVTLVGACTSGGAPTSSSSVPPSVAATGVDGKTYLSTAIEGATLVPGTRIRLAFKDGSLSANAGCNQMAGAYTISAGRLTTNGMSTTEMGCDQARMQQDEWLARLLGGATITLSGDTLTLTEGPIRVTLLDREVASPDLPLAGTHWVLDGIISGDVASSVPAAVTASIRIANGATDINTGCNTGSGTVMVATDALTFGPLTLTKKACDQAPASVQHAILAVLTGTVRYSIEAGVLTIDGVGAGLSFRAATGG